MWISVSSLWGGGRQGVHNHYGVGGQGEGGGQQRRGFDNDDDGDKDCRARRTLSQCCWRRGENTIINIRWEVGGGRRGGCCEGGSCRRRPAVHCASIDYCDRSVSVYCDRTTVHPTATAVHRNCRLRQPLRWQPLMLSFEGQEEVAVMRCATVCNGKQWRLRQSQRRR